MLEHKQAQYTLGPLLLICSMLVLIGCRNKPEQIEVPILRDGSYLGLITQQGKELPFNFQLTDLENTPKFIIQNGEEELLIDDLDLSVDSLKVVMNIFDAELRCKIVNKGLEGVYEKFYLDDHILPFKATFGVNERFLLSSNEPVIDISGSYELSFKEVDGTVYPAVGKFKQEGNHLTGTFLTKTGDYRYLEGIVDGDSLKLSGFDGSHLFLFTAMVKGDSLVGGEFWHGKYTYEKWSGVKNMAASLPDAYNLTYLKKGFEKFEVHFPDLDSNIISLSHPKFEDKALIIQIMGTWCPNCMDETIFLSEWYQNNKHRDVEVVGLAFEQKRDFQYARKRIKIMKEKLDVPYDILIAGVSDKEEASKSLPMLNHVIAYPTTIFLNKQRQVLEIHTGFNGPGTGDAFDAWKDEFKVITDKLIGGS